MITREKAQALAALYNAEVVDVETLHDGDSIGYIADNVKDAVLIYDEVGFR